MSHDSAARSGSIASPRPRVTESAPPPLGRGFPRSHRGAVLLLTGCALAWSLAGVISRHLHSAAGVEVTFWRSFFCMLTMAAILSLQPGPGAFRQIWAMGWIGLASGTLWAVMFTCFMIAIMLTTVANTLLVLSLSPLLAALLGWWVLGARVRAATWLAIAIAGFGIWWMVRDSVSIKGAPGLLIALGVPVASAINVVTLKRTQARIDLGPAVLLGALISCAATLPFALPWRADAHDLGLLAVLGAVQLAIPCWLMVRASAWLAPHEVALIALLEVVLGPIWAWLGAGEALPAATVEGGLMVILALVLSEGWAARRRSRGDPSP